jgi:hypothetical protein
MLSSFLKVSLALAPLIEAQDAPGNLSNDYDKSKLETHHVMSDGGKYQNLKDY